MDYRELEAIERRRFVEAAVLTHAYPDHIGFVERPREPIDVPIWLHEPGRTCPCWGRFTQPVTARETCGTRRTSSFRRGRPLGRDIDPPMTAVETDRQQGSHRTGIGDPIDGPLPNANSCEGNGEQRVMSSHLNVHHRSLQPIHPMQRFTR